MPGIDPRKVRNIQVFGVFDYLLSKRLKIEMKGIMHVNLDTPNGMSRGFIIGDL
jgi:hypothetical protein